MAKIKKKKGKKIDSGVGEVVADVTGKSTVIKKKKSKKKKDAAIKDKKSAKIAKKKKVAEKESSAKAVDSDQGEKETRVTVKNVRLSLRIAKKVTSITLDTNVVSMWLLFCTDDNPSDYKLVKGRINEFVYANLASWERPDGKGLSEFIINRMIKACLDQKDFKLYKKFVKCLSGSKE